MCAGRDLRDQVADLLIVPAGPQRFHDFPVIPSFPVPFRRPRFSATRRVTCVGDQIGQFASRNSSGFFRSGFLTDCAARKTSFEFSSRTYILPSRAASLPNKISGGASVAMSNFRRSFALAQPYSSNLLLSASISFAEMVASFCQSRDRRVNCRQRRRRPDL